MCNVWMCKYFTTYRILIGNLLLLLQNTNLTSECCYYSSGRVSGGFGTRIYYVELLVRCMFLFRRRRE